MTVGVTKRSHWNRSLMPNMLVPPAPTMVTTTARLKRRICLRIAHRVHRTIAPVNRGRCAAWEVWPRGGASRSFLRRGNAVRSVLACQERTVRPRVGPSCSDRKSEAQRMEFSMRYLISYTALVLAAGASVAQAQTIETIITPQSGRAVIAREPIAAPPAGVLVSQPAPVV